MHGRLVCTLAAFGFQGSAAFPRLPDTKGTLARAVRNISTLPAPVIPGAGQAPPVQETGPRPRPRTTTREG